MRIRNWSKHQHFKDRRPPWIKLYRDVLDDHEWHNLDGDAAKLLVMLWLLASENVGNITDDKKKLAFRFRVTESFINKHLPALSHWLIQDDIKEISARYQDGSPEEEKETEKEKETEEEKEHIHVAPTETSVEAVIYQGKLLTITDEIHKNLIEIYDEGLCMDQYPKADLWMKNNPQKRRKRIGSFMANWMENAAKRFKGNSEQTGALGLSLSQLGIHGQEQAKIGQRWLARHETKEKGDA